MKALITIICIGIIGHSPVPAQSLRYPVALPYTALSAYNHVQSDPFSFTSNQAALAGVKQPMIGVFGERRFMLDATGAYRLAAVMPTHQGGFGLQLDYAGFSNFSESRIGLAYGRSLGSAVDLGIQFNYYGYRIPVYGNASACYVEGGAIFHASERWEAGIHVYNPIGGKLGKAPDEKLASEFSAGLGYEISPDLFAGIEVVKEEDRYLYLVSGIQYRFADSFFVRAGLVSDTGSLFAGVGAGWNKLRVDLSASYHPVLGFSPGILFVVTF